MLDLDGDDGTVSIGRAYYSIWDAGGNDTISYNGQMDALINLNTAQVSKNEFLNNADPELEYLVNKMMDSGELRTEFLPEVIDEESGIGGYFSRLYDINGDV